jgi:hypothetical protein
MSALLDVVAADPAYAKASAIYYGDQGAHPERGGMYIAFQALLEAALAGSDLEPARLALAGCFTEVDTRSTLFYRDAYLTDPNPLRRALGEELAAAFDAFEAASLAAMLDES